MYQIFLIPDSDTAGKSGAAAERNFVFTADP
jgi:hypothetical protein